MSPPRAVVVLTGSELVRGAIADGNGAFLGRELTALGLEPAGWTVVGDRPEELEAALGAALGADLAIVTGGLGPTHDDRTVETVARLLGRPLHVDETLEGEIEAVARAVAERLDRPYADLAGGVRKQASLPEGAVSLGLAGTAPALLIEHERGVAVLLPGPPGELRRLWPRALEHPALQAVAARAEPREHLVVRLYGEPESSVAGAVADAGGESDGVEITVCARNLEVEVEVFFRASAKGAAERVVAELEERFAERLFARDRRPLAAVVLDLAREGGLTLATAESCTAGLVAAALTDVPGSSDVFRGGIVAYANEAKESLLGVPASMLAKHGAVSAETAEAMATGALVVLGADVAVAVTGIAGPDGGTPEKPVGLVHVAVAGSDGVTGTRVQLPGDRDEVRSRAVALSLHEVRRVLAQMVRKPRVLDG